MSEPLKLHPGDHFRMAEHYQGTIIDVSPEGGRPGRTAPTQ
jgi:hypothetical protein